MKPIKIKQDVMNTLLGNSRCFKTKAGLLGKKKGVISKVLFIKSGSGGCCNFPRLEHAELTKAYKTLTDEGYTAVGFARVGENLSTQDDMYWHRWKVKDIIITGTYGYYDNADLPNIHINVRRYGKLYDTRQKNLPYEVVE